MPFMQDDRDRIEDLGLDPNGDQTEDLRRHAELVEAAKRILRSDEPPHTFGELVDRTAQAVDSKTPPKTDSAKNQVIEGESTHQQEK